MNHQEIEDRFIKLLKELEIEDELVEYLYNAYLPVAAWIANQNRPLVIGINGAQGSGKSTLSLILELLLTEHHQFNVATLSIDDLYKSQSQRQQMAEDIHPLFSTRGVPGTHDVALGCKTIRSLLSDEPTTIPRFDKSADNPLPRSEWPQFNQAADIVLFEGWCVGAKAQHENELNDPINLLEENEDSHGEWRHFVNRQLQQEYLQLFEMIDRLIVLEIPHYEKVSEWRTLQESKQDRPMDSQKLNRFIMHFERLTRHMLTEMPGRADVLLSIDNNHQIEQIEIRHRES